MTQVTDILEHIRNTLRNQMINSDFPHFGSTLDMVEETLSITIVGTDICLIVKQSLGLPNDHSAYSRTFDETNDNFQRNTKYNDHNDYNDLFLRCQERYLNHLLQTRGHVFLNEVYDQLGFERTSDGAIVGWVYNKDDEEPVHIDFGYNPEAEEKTIFLNFNVQGVIYDKI